MNKKYDQGCGVQKCEKKETKQYLKGYIGSVWDIQPDLVLVLVGDFCSNLGNSHLEI